MSLALYRGSSLTSHLNMGGHALPDLQIPRMVPIEYANTREKCIGILETFYGNITFPPKDPGKVDYGDVDFIVSTTKHDFSARDLRKALGALKHASPSYLVSFAVPYSRNGKSIRAQVDVLECKEGDMECVNWMESYGELYQIFALLSQHVRLRMTKKGLLLKIPEVQLPHQKKTILFLTRDV